jgi:curved DNA-binding protein CbpA
MRDHLVIAAQLVRAAKRNDTNEVTRLEKKWYENADELAKFLSRINPNWSESEIKTMMHEHLALTEKEAIAILKNEWEQSINLFSKIEHQAFMMANTYIKGLVAQFPDKFKRE